ncbi:MAG: tetratricopeptide repeat protein [Treponema sp.]|nr:tetratricopeptide repeat protein [Treponema sp.]
MAERNNSKECEDKFLEMILKYSGLTVSSSHRDFMLNFIQERKKKLSMSDEDYCRKLEEDIEERNLIIDEAAINETYFFREESQFDFLKNKYFPNHKDVVIWSAACSTGEEAVSLYALAKACNVDAKVFASDIDKKALSLFKNGYYPPHSFRNEGSPYIHLLEPLGTYYPKSFTMAKETLDRLSISCFNLATDENFPMPFESVDLLFLRNVFIYFTKETRKAVLIKMAKAMKPGALLFLSINEIASIECDDDMPFIKENCDSVYYLRKASPEEKQRCHELKQNRLEQNSLHKPLSKKVPRFNTVKCNDATVSTKKQCSISEFYKNLKTAINSRQIDYAREMLSSHTFKPTEMEHELYMKGLIFEAEGNDKEALDCYQRASILNPKFWPALYNLGVLYKKTGNAKNMKKAFSSCSNALKCYIQNQEICYNDIVDSFSPDYFLELCESQIEGGR